jgi:hypothetical protein
MAQGLARYNYRATITKGAYTAAVIERGEDYVQVYNRSERTGQHHRCRSIRWICTYQVGTKERESIRHLRLVVPEQGRLVDSGMPSPLSRAPVPFSYDVRRALLTGGKMSKRCKAPIRSYSQSQRPDHTRVKDRKRILRASEVEGGELSKAIALSDALIASARRGMVI